MKRSSALLFQVVVVLIGIAVVSLLLWEPHVEGRNAHATTFEIYFKDPFLAYEYVGSIPFFVALQQAFQLLGDVRRTGTFSQGSLNSLRAIKRCAMAILGFVAGAVLFILKFGDGDDRPAGIFMCLLVASGAGIAATAAAMWGRNLQRALTRADGLVP